MTGGGIGIDYSVYRKSNSILSGTGGFASGPIPKMLMINEIGRNVMQGGSRRSAIYASLNWRHGDIDRFLTVKNWQGMMVPGTRLTWSGPAGGSESPPRWTDQLLGQLRHAWYLPLSKPATQARF